MKHYDKAVADCTEAIRLDPKDAYSYSVRSWAYGYLGEYDKEMADATEAVRLDPKDSQLYIARGKCRHILAGSPPTLNFTRRQSA